MGVRIKVSHVFLFSSLSLYERAVVSAGLEFRSDKLWDHYIQWETSKKRVVEAFALFKRLIAVPTQLYSANFEKYVDLMLFPPFSRRLGENACLSDTARFCPKRAFVFYFSVDSLVFYCYTDSLVPFSGQFHQICF